MGAVDFTAYADGADPQAAFRAAREHAAYEHGHGGYTGTVAEKDGFRVLATDPVSSDAANALVSTYLETSYGPEDPERWNPYTDKWGEAGALPISNETRTVVVTVAEMPSQDEAARYAAAFREVGRKRLIRRGEKIVATEVQQYRTADTRSRSTRVTDVRLLVTIRKAKSAPPTVDGWLFFGSASS